MKTSLQISVSLRKKSEDNNDEDREQDSNIDNDANHDEEDDEDEDGEEQLTSNRNNYLYEVIEPGTFVTTVFTPQNVGVFCFWPGVGIRIHIRFF